MGIESDFIALKGLYRKGMGPFFQSSITGNHSATKKILADLAGIVKGISKNIVFSLTGIHTIWYK